MNVSHDDKWKEPLIEFRRECSEVLERLHPNDKQTALKMRTKLNTIQECFSRIHSSYGFDDIID